jgi:1-acyl-sn-glycerol-3-phosphate acyltransferase
MPGPVSRVLAPVRSALAYLVISLYILLVGPPALVIASVFAWPNLLYQLGGYGVWIGMAILGLRYRVEGREHIQRGRAAIYCVNHVSNVDPPLAFMVLRQLFPHLQIVYKAVLRKTPVLGRAFHIAGFVPLDRGNQDQTTSAVAQAVRQMHAGKSFLVYPEGTRSRTGELLPFKKGAFIMAIEAQVPIVPMAIVGSRAAMAKGSPMIYPVTILIRLGEPIPTVGLTFDDRDRLMTLVRERIVELLGGDAGQGAATWNS